MAEQLLAWIIGGSRGIGLACAKQLAQEGYALAISARDEIILKNAASTIGEAVSSVLAVPCDVSKEYSVKTAHEDIKAKFGKAPDVLINSAGISPWSTFSETSVEEFDTVMSINLRGMFLTSRVVLPDMYARGSGTIVNLLSVASIKPFKNGAAYIASKYGARGLTNTLREEAHEYGVRVIGVIPGATETEMWSAEERQRYHNRMMQPEDVAQAVLAALRESNRAVMEEIILRPLQGDI